MKKSLLVALAISVSLFFVPVVNAENGGIKLTYDDLFKGKNVSLIDEHNNVVFPANIVATVTPKGGKSFGFMTQCETLFDLQAGDYMFAGKELVLTDK